eukprot:7267903-Prymnesium_polylepis.1
MRCCEAPACLTRRTCPGAGRGGSESCRRRGRGGCACGAPACARRLARGVADLRQVRSRVRAPG